MNQTPYPSDIDARVLELLRDNPSWETADAYRYLAEQMWQSLSAPPSGEQAAQQRIGVRVECTECGLQKKPRGRSGPPMPMCDDECPGYSQEPRVGDLWPGETQEDFGYPVSADGTEMAPVEDQSPKGEVK